MIQNEHQYKITQGEIKKLQQVLEKILEQSEIMSGQQLAAMQNSFQTQIDRMQAEIKEYNDLKVGKVEITMASFA